jgi:hypothetical protein
MKVISSSELMAINLGLISFRWNIIRMFFCADKFHFSVIMKNHPKQRNEMKEFCIIVNKYKRKYEIFFPFAKKAQSRRGEEFELFAARI